MIALRVKCADQAEPLSFLLDSGAGGTVFDLAAARRIGLSLGRRAKVQGVSGECDACCVKNIAASVGGVPIAREALALDLSGVSRACGVRVDGLIGLDFFRGRAVQIDYAAHKVRLLERTELGQAAGKTIPISLRGDSACVRVSVGDRPAEWMRVDTGCDSALEWAGNLGGGNKTRPSFATARGSQRRIRADVTLGSESLHDVAIGLHDHPLFAGEAGLVGNALLSRYQITFDLAGHRLLLNARRTK
jgi:hypothetical protein